MLRFSAMLMYCSIESGTTTFHTASTAVMAASVSIYYSALSSLCLVFTVSLGLALRI